MNKDHTTGHNDTPVFFDGTGRRWLFVRILTVSLGVLLLLFITWTTPHVIAERRVPSFAAPHLQLPSHSIDSPAVKQLGVFAQANTHNGTAVIGTGAQIRLAKVVVDTSGCYIADPTTNEKIRPLSYTEVLYIGNDTHAYLRYGDSESPTPSVHELAGIISRKNTAVIGKGPLIRLIKVTRTADATYATDPFTHATIEQLKGDILTYLNGDAYALQRYGHTEGKRIALTFDDGPDPRYTPQLLDLLAEESAQASFFVVGTNTSKYPDIASRLVREGHTIANHSFTHVDFDYVGQFSATQEINQTQRVIAATTKFNTPFYRPPYGGNTDQSFRNSLRSILYAQKLGYTVTSYDFDSNDWQFTQGVKPVMPKFDGKDKVVLVHDSGGDRSLTLSYVKSMITAAKKEGYTFVNLTDLYPQIQQKSLYIQPGFADYVALNLAQAALVWPLHAIQILFGFSVIMIAVTTLINVTAALLHHRNAKKRTWKTRYRPRVTVIVPAYNEGVVIVKSVRSILQSKYRKIEVLIIDDGSTDDTWSIACELENQYKRVRAIHQQNAGKATALNNAINEAKGDIVICVDADTLFPAESIGNMVRHFQDASVAAVAGVVKVGNVSNMLTRWQMLEYTVSIAIDRNAHSQFNAIMIIPGACGAWRKSILQAAGGFSHTTLAEDCDMTINIQQLNRYRIVQENSAVCYTEAPDRIAALTKQRFRWTFGNIQALWKHRNMLFNHRYGWLGMFIMPNSLTSIIIPLFFWPLLAYISIQNVLNGNYQIILVYFLITMLLQFIVAAIGLHLARERMSLLWAVPFARFVYGPIRLYLLYKTVLTVLKGSYVGWNKLLRTGTAAYPFTRKHLTPVVVRSTDQATS